jgi:two-component system sensor histidine kinase/response regulator
MPVRADSRPTSSRPGTAGPVVLVVDDAADSRELLMRRLGREGYSLLEADSGPAALAVLAREPVELVLLDVTMPGMGGLEVLESIRADHDLASLPVLMVTALGEAQDVVMAMERGANDYITKPVEWRVLLARVRTALKLKRLYDQRQHFLRVASHDLKNPLLAVVGTTELLRDAVADGRPLGERGQRLLRNVHEAGVAAQRIVRDLVDSHAIEDGQLVLRRTAIDLAALVADVVEANLPRATAKGIDLVADLPEVLGPLLGDDTRLRQVLDNLLSNAVKFSEAGSTTRARVRVEGPSVRIEVIDGGPGLRDGDLRLAFGRYARLSARPTGHETSTGLGLAIVAELVRLHGGDVGVHNNAAGTGATFWISLPLSGEAQGCASAAPGPTG